MVLPIGALLGIGGSLLGGAIQAGAANRATQAGVEASQQQMDLYRQIYGDQRSLLAPYRQIGQNALAQYANEFAGGYEQSPGYQFQLEQGQRAIDNSAAASGQLFSGATQKAQLQFGQGMAAQDYGNWLNRLQGLSAMGQNAASGTGAAAAQFGQMGGSALGNQGNAMMSGAIAGGNAVNSGIQNALGAYGYMSQFQ